MDERKEEKQGAQAADMEVAAEPGPELRRGPGGGPAFAATIEPEYRSTEPDGRTADPKGAGEEPYVGATMQDDPVPTGYFTYADEGRGGDLTLVAVFEDITGARSCATDLERRELGVEVAIVARNGAGPEQGLRPGNVITGEGYGLSAEGEQQAPKDEHMGSGVAVGATLGATTGLLAATYAIPPFGTLVATGSLVSTLVGAGLGSFLGGLWDWGARDPQDDATLYAGQVRRGGVILLARTDRAQAEAVRRLMEVWNPLEIRVQ